MGRTRTLDDILRAMCEIDDLDIEQAHLDGDKLLCEALRVLGQDELVDEWDKLFKWYA